MGKMSSEATALEQSLREALAAIVGDADNTGCEGSYVVDGALIERAQQLLKVRKEAAVMEPAPGMKLWLGVHSHRHGVGPMLLQAPTNMSVEDISNWLAHNDPQTYELHREDEWLQIEGVGQEDILDVGS